MANQANEQCIYTQLCIYPSKIQKGGTNLLNTKVEGDVDGSLMRLARKC